MDYEPILHNLKYMCKIGNWKTTTRNDFYSTVFAYVKSSPPLQSLKKRAAVSNKSDFELIFL